MNRNQLQARVAYVLHSARLVLQTRRSWNSVFAGVDFFARPLLDRKSRYQPRDFRFGATRLAVRPCDWVAAEEILVNCEYAVVADLLRGRPSPLVVDLGANIGLFSVYALSCNPAARILAVEPDPDTYNLLQANLAATGSASWQAVQAAVTATSGTVRLARTAVSTGSHVVADDDAANARTIDVPGMPLPQLIAASTVTGDAHETVDLLKIDIEGSEEAVLAVSREVLQRTRHCIVEVHPPRSDAAHVQHILEQSFASVQALAGRQSRKPLWLASRARP